MILKVVFVTFFILVNRSILIYMGHQMDLFAMKKMKPVNEAMQKEMGITFANVKRNRR